MPLKRISTSDFQERKWFLGSLDIGYVLHTCITLKFEVRLFVESRDLDSDPDAF